MTEEILSVAVWEPVPEMEAASLATLRELSSILTAKGYGRDLLYRDRESHYVLVRHWKSEEARSTAQAGSCRCRIFTRTRISPTSRSTEIQFSRSAHSSRDISSSSAPTVTRCESG